MSSVTHPPAGGRIPAPQPDAAPVPGVDDREQLVNGGETGPIGRVSLPTDIITKLNGIMLDFDPDLYDATKFPAGATESPARLYETVVGPMLNRHPLYAKAQVRDTGRGVHALLWFDVPVVFRTAAERQRWAAVVQTVQRALPTDPACPGITATTRPVGSVNGKTDRPVSIITAGAPVTAEEVLAFVTEFSAKPFKIVAGFLLDPVAPSCPLCSTPGNRLGVLDKFGSCYVGKHKPKVGDLFDIVFARRVAAGEA